MCVCNSMTFKISISFVTEQIFLSFKITDPNAKRFGHYFKRINGLYLNYMIYPPKGKNCFQFPLTSTTPCNVLFTENIFQNK